MEGASLGVCLDEVGRQSSHGRDLDFLLVSGLLFLLQVQPQVALSFLLGPLLFLLPLAFFTVETQRPQTTIRNTTAPI